MGFGRLVGEGFDPFCFGFYGEEAAARFEGFVCISHVEQPDHAVFLSQAQEFFHDRGEG